LFFLNKKKRHGIARLDPFRRAREPFLNKNVNGIDNISFASMFF
jgi:hypothetical protein